MSRSRSRSPHRGQRSAVALTGRPQGDRALTGAAAEAPPPSEGYRALTGAAAQALWPAFEARAPAVDDSLGMLRWCLLATSRPPEALPLTTWTAAERHAALAGMASLCREPAPSAFAPVAAQLTGEAAEAAHRVSLTGRPRDRALISAAAQAPPASTGDSALAGAAAEAPPASEARAPAVDIALEWLRYHARPAKRDAFQHVRLAQEPLSPASSTSSCENGCERA